MNISKKIILFIFFVFLIASFIFILVKQKENRSNSLLTAQIKNSSSSENNVSSFIDQLRQREYAGGEIRIEDTLSSNSSYTKYLISYPSDDLKIYGIMNVPTGNGPFPVIILNHGYFNASTFNSGDGTQAMADILTRKGYITLASDYRGFGKSENDAEASRGHNPNYSIDILNLISSVKSLPEADPSRIGMWGHSMGGEVSLRAAEATDKIKAIVLWAPTSGNASDNTRFYASGRSNTGTTNSDSDGISPINYLKYIKAPISLHQGLEDTEVNPQWSKQLNESLKKEGKEIEYFEYPGQDHNFRNLGWDKISESTVSFFDKYLK